VSFLRKEESNAPLSFRKGTYPPVKTVKVKNGKIQREKKALSLGNPRHKTKRRKRGAASTFLRGEGKEHYRSHSQKKKA